MKKLLALLLICGLVVVTAGCPSTTTTKTTGTQKAPANGGPTRKDSVAKDPMLTVTVDDITVDKGKKAMATVKVKRDNFDEDVMVKFEVPEASKLKVKDTSVLKGGKGEVEVEVDATDAAKGEYPIKVKASGGKAKEASDDFKVTVKE